MKNDRDFSRMFDKGNKLIGCLNFNNMLPVDDSVLLPIDMRVQKGDSAKERAYKSLLNDQLDWCNDNFDAITIKAEKLYKIVTETPDKMKNLTRRCCDFKKLELVLIVLQGKFKFITDIVNSSITAKFFYKSNFLLGMMPGC